MEGMAIGRLSQFVLKHAGQVCSTETDHVIIPHQGSEDVIARYSELPTKWGVVTRTHVRVIIYYFLYCTF